MDPRRPRRAHWERSRSDGNGSSSDRPPEYVHPLDMQAGGEAPPWEGREAPAWERPAPDPFEPPQTTRLVPVGPSRPMSRRTDESDWPDDEQEPTSDDLDDAQAPVFAAETMLQPDLRQPDDRARYVSHAAGRPDFAVPPLAQPAPRPPASIGDQPVGPTPPANLFAPPAEPPEPETAEQPNHISPDASPPWVSTSSRTVGPQQVAWAAQPAPAEVVVRIELVIIDEAGRVAAAQGPAEPGAVDAHPAEPKAAPEPDEAAREAPAPVATPPAPARSSAPVRAAVRIVGVLALVGIGLFLVQLGAWLVR